MQSCREDSNPLHGVYELIAIAFKLFFPSALHLIENLNKELKRMKYINAQSVFPESLLAEIQKYVQGETVYIPKSPTNYKKWGTDTGAKNIIAQRNEMMVHAFKTGISVPQLMESYNLAEDTIKKIVYGKN